MDRSRDELPGTFIPPMPSAFDIGPSVSLGHSLGFPVRVIVVEPLYQALYLDISRKCQHCTSNVDGPFTFIDVWITPNSVSPAISESDEECCSDLVSRTFET